MGSQVNIWLDEEKDITAIVDEVEAIEAQLSRFRSQSELNTLNRQTQRWVYVSETLQVNVEQALYAAYLTEGLVTPLVLRALVMAGYDRDFPTLEPTFVDGPIHLHDWQDIQILEGRVWVPDEIDLGGTAKGWTAQHIARQFDRILVDMGGDIVARGKLWKVYVADPFDPETLFTTVLLEDMAIATSGTDYRRWGVEQHHIIDPRTARPAITDVLSATVIYPDAVMAEAMAKAVLLLGSQQGLEWLQQHPHAAGLVFCHDGAVLATDNFQSYIQQGA